MNRKPPAKVVRQLRREVGFGCPVEGCGNPYLSWHHFDPPWREKPHHNPEGMIALCAEHHDQADAGAFTKAQLREMKKRGKENSSEIKGKFNWMRRDILAVVGGNFYYKVPVVFEFRKDPSIWFERDEEGYFLLNVRMLSKSNQPRMRIENNIWIARGEPDDFQCPPSGKLINARYENGDSLKVEFFELASSEEVKRKYDVPWGNFANILFPITAVEISTEVGGTDIRFGPRSTMMSGLYLQNNFFEGCRVGIALD